MSEWGKELLFVSPGAGGKELCKEWCFRTEEAVLLSSSSSSSEADPIRESVTKKENVFRLISAILKTNIYKQIFERNFQNYQYLQPVDLCI